jgi:hypothetical protein
MSSFFSDREGRWINPEDEFIGDLTADLKAIIAGLADPTNELFVKVDQLLYDYFALLQHGETSHLTKKVEWILFESPTGRVTITYKDGSEWFDECWSDELPKWLLNAILRKLQRSKPLGDQKADEVIKDVRDAEADYVEKRLRSTAKGIKLNTSRFSEEESDGF